MGIVRQADYAAPHGVLPQWYFVVESPALTAFYARSYGGMQYAEPALFVIHSLDGKPLPQAKPGSNRGFGDSRVEFRGKTLEVATEKLIP